MNTIALRFADHFAPEEGTIEAHMEHINIDGYVWYGKLGNRISPKVKEQILENDTSKILLIQSGKTNRYWAYVDEIQYEVPNRKHIPEYYRDMAGKFGTWFKITRFEKADKGIMAKCKVTSSGALLSNASRHSMSPYFIISVEE